MRIIFLFDSEGEPIDKLLLSSFALFVERALLRESASDVQ